MTGQGRLVWLGHSTVVLDLDGARVVTDPVLTRRVGHLWRRAAVPALEGAVDAVVVSHLHWDHFQIQSLRRLAKDALAVVPAGAERLVGRLGFERVVAVRSGDVVRVGALEVQATHADHPVSRRYGARATAVGFLIRGSRRVYFAGDTDLFEDMRLLADGLEVTLLPVGGWGPAVPAGHLDAVKAARALELLRPRIAVPIHWGTFAPLGLARFGGSHHAAEEFRLEAARRAPKTKVHILEIGSGLTF